MTINTVKPAALADHILSRRLTAETCPLEGPEAHDALNQELLAIFDLKLELYALQLETLKDVRGVVAVAAQQVQYNIFNDDEDSPALDKAVAALDALLARQPA